MPAGAYRRVFRIGHLAIKLPRLRQYTRGLRCNRWEFEVWHTWRHLFDGWTEVLCPVLWGDRWGLVLVMAHAVQPVRWEEMVAAMEAGSRYPDVDVEYKPENYGWLGGRIVAVDYGIDDAFDLEHRRAYLRSKAFA